MVPPRIELRSREPKSPILAFILWNLTVEVSSSDVGLTVFLRKQIKKRELSIILFVGVLHFVLSIQSKMSHEPVTWNELMELRAKEEKQAKVLKAFCSFLSFLYSC